MPPTIGTATSANESGIYKCLPYFKGDDNDQVHDQRGTDSNSMLMQILKLLRSSADDAEWLIRATSIKDAEIQDEELHSYLQFRNLRLVSEWLEGEEDDTSTSSVEQQNRNLVEEFIQER